MKVLVLGSLNMDLVMEVSKMPSIGETVLGDNVSYFFGGKGANQAVACRRLGVPVTLVGKVGNDTFGDKLMIHMNMAAIDMSQVKLEAGAFTGTAAIMKLPEDNAIVVLPGANQLVTPDDLKEDVLEQAQVLLAQLEIPLATVMDAFKRAKEKGLITILNPAPYHEAVEEMLPFVDYITPNEREFRRMVQTSSEMESFDLEAAMLSWSKKQETQLIVTRGSKGVSYVLEGKVKTVAAPRMAVTDTTGAGDTFNGILAATLAKKEPLETAVLKASFGASLSVTKMGAQSGMPSEKQLAEFMAKQANNS